jgi:hypothetical protein
MDVYSSFVRKQVWTGRPRKELSGLRNGNFQTNDNEKGSDRAENDAGGRVFGSPQREANWLTIDCVK